jgi:hypothetical protein
MSAMVIWKPQKENPKKKSITLASFRHVPVGSPAPAAASRVEAEATAAADAAIDDMERQALVNELIVAVKTAVKFGVPDATIKTFQDAIDDQASASVAQLRAILENVKVENKKALDA